MNEMEGRDGYICRLNNPLDFFRHGVKLFEHGTITVIMSWVSSIDAMSIDGMVGKPRKLDDDIKRSHSLSTQSHGPEPLLGFRRIHEAEFDLFVVPWVSIWSPFGTFQLLSLVMIRLHWIVTWPCSLPNVVVCGFR